MLIEGMMWLFVLWIFSGLVTGLLILSELETKEIRARNIKIAQKSIVIENYKT